VWPPCPVPTKTWLLPSRLPGTPKEEKLWGHAKIPKHLLRILPSLHPRQLLWGKRRGPVTGAGQSGTPARDHSCIPAPWRLAPCHRTRMLQDTPLWLGHLPTGTLTPGTVTASQRSIDSSQCSEPGVPAHPCCLCCLYGPLVLPSSRRHDLLQKKAFFPGRSYRTPLPPASCVPPDNAALRRGSAPSTTASSSIPHTVSSRCLQGVCTSLTNCNGLNSFTGRCSLQFFPLLTASSLQSCHE